MAIKTHIEWTHSTWNPVTGCTKISAGCKHCYAERMARRLEGTGQPRYRNCFDVTLQEDLVEQPLSWRKPRVIFVCSMGDLFHEDVPDDYIKRVFETMKRADKHVFQVLTKRAERLAMLADELPWPSNVWAGVTVERADYVSRIDMLRRVPAQVRFLSLEPLLGPLPNLKLAGIGWVIVGGESGPGARPIKADWVRDIRDQCDMANVPFFFKQWGGKNKKEAGRELDGQTYSATPVLPEEAQLTLTAA
jgi:protein gp37